MVTSQYLLPLRQACAGGIPVLAPGGRDAEATDDEEGGGDGEEVVEVDVDNQPLEPG